MARFAHHGESALPSAITLALAPTLTVTQALCLTRILDRCKHLGTLLMMVLGESASLVLEYEGEDTENAREAIPANALWHQPSGGAGQEMVAVTVVG